MIQFEWNPETGKLRQFGWIALAGFGVIGLLLAHRLGCFGGRGSWAWPTVIWGFAVVCPMLGYVSPQLLRVIYVAMMAIALPIGIVVSTTLLICLFFLMFVPLALWFRLLRRDELKLRWNEQASSYWIPIEGQRSPASYYRQF